MAEIPQLERLPETDKEETAQFSCVLRQREQPSPNLDDTAFRKGSANTYWDAKVLG